MNELNERLVRIAGDLAALGQELRALDQLDVGFQVENIATQLSDEVRANERRSAKNLAVEGSEHGDEISSPSAA